MATISGDFATGLQAHWIMDESSGTRYDSTDNNNDLTEHGTGGVGSGTGVGGSGTAADFEADDSDYLDIADASQTGLDGSDTMSFSLWVNLETAVDGNPKCLFEKIGSGAGYYCQIYTYNANNIFFTWNDGSGSAQAGADMSLGTGAWHHIVVTYNNNGAGSGIAFYLDGVSKTPGNVSGTGRGTCGNGDTFQVGMNATVQKYDGKIAHFTVWRGKVLNSTEVSTLYNSGTPLAYSGGGGGGDPTPTRMMMGIGS